MAEDKPKKGFTLPPVPRRIIDASVDIQEAQPDQADFLHAVLCQVGMPRKRTEERSFERRNGKSIMKLEAGELWNGTDLVEQPLPYGPCPRLVMVHISSEAIKNKSADVDIGSSTREFLTRLGIPTTGGKRGGYTNFKKQMQALAACSLTLGFTSQDGRALTIHSNPIEEFEAWIQEDGQQLTMWPGRLRLSNRFYETLIEHAVPLDTRALKVLKHSALSLDIYTWLAHRLCRVRHPNGVRLSWANLMNQFGQEYNDLKSFKNRFFIALRQVKAVYPDAKFEIVRGGMLLYPSPPPLPKTQVVVELPPAKSKYLP